MTRNSAIMQVSGYSTCFLSAKNKNQNINLDEQTFCKIVKTIGQFYIELSKITLHVTLYIYDVLYHTYH